jgi:hypothetical protein
MAFSDQTRYVLQNGRSNLTDDQVYLLDAALERLVFLFNAVREPDINVRSEARKVGEDQAARKCEERRERYLRETGTL